MPVKIGKDKKGNYAKWGDRGKKYYFKSAFSKSIAVNKALTQGRAIHVNKLR